ncbi:MAG: hypothetical protein RLW68_15775 [Devosia marina]|uniref:serine O-acetyltransferase n=1 Tax=Devosia marina TaxID=2683198 RepID=UPI000D5C85FE
MKIRNDLEANTGKSGAVNAILYFLVNPGYMSAKLYRFYSWADKQSLVFKAASKLAWRFSILVSSCHISPKSCLGDGLEMPHPTGIVIGDGVEIGSNARIFQNVTIGQSGNTHQYPKIGCNVTIYAGVTIFGGIEIGDNCTIGANSVVNKSVLANSTVAGNPARPLSALVSSPPLTGS